MARCLVCNKEFDFEVEYCCDGTNCACRGEPIDIPICSSECWDVVLNSVNKKEENE